MKKLDLNALEQPTLELTLKDENKTKIHILVPEERQVERIEAAAAELPDIVADKSGVKIKALFDFMAELLGDNMEGLTFTAEELRDKYRLRLYDLVFITKAYLSFLEEIKLAKN